MLVFFNTSAMSSLPVEKISTPKSCSRVRYIKDRGHERFPSSQPVLSKFHMKKTNVFANQMGASVSESIFTVDSEMSESYQSSLFYKRFHLYKINLFI